MRGCTHLSALRVFFESKVDLFGSVGRVFFRRFIAHSLTFSLTLLLPVFKACGKLILFVLFWHLFSPFCPSLPYHNFYCPFDHLFLSSFCDHFLSCLYVLFAERNCSVWSVRLVTLNGLSSHAVLFPD